MVRFSWTAFPLVILLLFVGPAYPRDNAPREALVDALRDGLQSEATQRSVLEYWNIPDHAKSAYLDHFNALGAERAYVEALADNLLPLFDLIESTDLASLEELAFALALSTTTEFAALGMRRLPTDDLRFIYRHIRALSTRLDDQRCVALYFGTLPAEEITRLEMEYASTLDDAELRHYLAITRKAILAEIRQTPSVQDLTVSQRDVADRILGARLAGHPESEALAQALEFPDSVSAHHLCWAMEEFLAIMLEDSSMAGGWMLRMLILDQQS